MNYAITIEAFKEVLKTWPTVDPKHDPCYLRVVHGISRYSSPPLYVKELKTLGGTSDLLIVPDTSGLDMGCKDPESTLVDLILNLITYEMQFENFDDADFDEYYALRERVYQAALLAKGLNNMV